MRSLELPNRTQAFIQPAKLTGYLLSETHSVGRSKAKFFRNLGFNEDTVSLLEQELLAIARSQEVTETLSTVHGMKYVHHRNYQYARWQNRHYPNGVDY